MARKKLNNGRAADPDANYGKEAAKKFSKGTFTASQTGAKQLAAKRQQMREMADASKSATSGTEDFEEFIRSGKYGGK